MQIKDSMISAKRKIAIWIDQKKLWHFVIIFALGVFLFGIAYFFLTSIQDGLASNTSPATQITIWTSFYFSVVTVSTLGYGDIVPQGLSKILACFEVIFGLTMMGIIVAKLTSGRLSYHVRRLFRSDMQRRLEIFSAAFTAVQVDFTHLRPKIGGAFQEIPTATVSNQRVECAAHFGRALIEFHARSLSFGRDILYELEQGDFFSDAPTEKLQETAIEIEQSLYLLGQLILALPFLARELLLNAENRRRISEIIHSLKLLNGKVSEHCKNQQLMQTFGQIAERCDTIPANYFSVPDTFSDRGQPDLVAPTVDQPQSVQ
jgi:ion channel